MKKAVCFLICILITASLCGCNSGYQSVSFVAMDTYVNINTDAGKETNDKIQSLIERFSQELDMNSPASAVYTLNETQKIYDTDGYVAELVSICRDYAEKTEGSFNPAYCDLKKAWNINSKLTSIPSEDKIKTALKTADYSKITVNDHEISLGGCKIDFGAAAKGYACDKAAELIGDKSGIISVGGSVGAYGKKNGKTDWQVAIIDPRDETKSLGTLNISDAVVSTSGDYEQFAVINGKRYHHIFGKNGYPADNSVISVSVISKSGVESDILSTALFVMGVDGALEYCNKNGVDCIIVEKGKRVYTSGGVRDYFVLENENYTYAN